MKDAFRELVNQSIDKKIKEIDLIHSTPAKVLKNLSNEMHTVQLIASGIELVIPNYSGSSLEVGESVQVFYQGDILSERTAYIGASIYKADSGGGGSGGESKDWKIYYAYGEAVTGDVTDEPRTIESIVFDAKEKTSVSFVFTATIWGSSNGLNTMFVSLDGVEQECKPRATVHNSENITMSFTFPFEVETGRHRVSVTSSGHGRIVEIVSYVWGQFIEEGDNFDPTSQDDYIWEIINGEARLIKYIGQPLAMLKTPTQIESSEPPIGIFPTRIFGNELFMNNTDIQSVKIPDGVRQIE